MLEKKIYYFDFENKYKKIISYIESFFMVVAFFLFIDMIIFFVLFPKISEIITDKNTQKVLCSLVTLIIFIFQLYGFIIQFFPKKIILTDSGIQIRRNNISRPELWHFNDNIKYHNIKFCEINDSSFRSRNTMALPFIMFNWDSVVMIQERFRTFYIPVENADDFIEEVNKRMLLAKENDI